jgi:hypothetical protein
MAYRVEVIRTPFEVGYVVSPPKEAVFHQAQCFPCRSFLRKGVVLGYAEKNKTLKGLKETRETGGTCCWGCLSLGRTGDEPR